MLPRWQSSVSWVITLQTILVRTGSLVIGLLNHQRLTTSQILSLLCLMLLVFWIYAVMVKWVSQTRFSQSLLILCVCLVSSPFSYSCKKSPKDAENLIEAATGAASALKSVYGTLFDVRIIRNYSFSAHCFQVDRLCHLLYPAPGNILDWMYKVVSIRYSYAVHLRDTGTVSVARHQGSR